MKKMTTLYKVDRETHLCFDEINPENAWVLDYAIPTRKFDGTSCAIIDGWLYKRYDAKNGKAAPIGAIPCQEPDIITGHHPHWIQCNVGDPEDKRHFEAFDAIEEKIDGTYELCGEKVNRNPEDIFGHMLIKHGSEILDLKDFSFDSIKEYLSNHDIEGIVFYDNMPPTKMCKIRKKDYGIKRLNP